MFPVATMFSNDIGLVPVAACNVLPSLAFLRRSIVVTLVVEIILFMRPRNHTSIAGMCQTFIVCVVSSFAMNSLTICLCLGSLVW